MSGTVTNLDLLQTSQNQKLLLLVIDLASSYHIELKKKKYNSNSCLQPQREVLDPLITFHGKNFQSSQQGDMVSPNTFYI